MRHLRAQGAALAAVLSMAAVAAASEWRPDEFVTTKIEIGLYEIAAVDPGAIEVRSEEGAVTLRGTVPSPEARERVEALARSVEGVKHVDNALRVGPGGAAQAPGPGPVDDEVVKGELVQTLSRDAALRDSEIAVESVEGGVVVLSGFAKSLKDQLRALQLTHDVAGVDGIRNHMKSPPDTLHDLDLGGAVSVGADAQNRRETQARSGRAVEEPAGAEAGDAPPGREVPGAPQVNPDAAGNTDPEAETTY